MATLTSRLIVSLIDGVTAPAKKAATGILGIPRAVNQANGQPLTFTKRLGVAIQNNNRALSDARGRMFDAVAGTFALRSAMMTTVGSAMALEDKMADIAKVSGMSEGELKKFEGVLRRMARSEIPLAVEELGDLAAAASQSGIANEDLEEFTRMVAKSAVAWEVSGGQAGESLAKIKTALGLSIEETRRYADVINFLSDSTASSAPDLVEFSRRVAADGKVAGFSSEQVLALGAAMISSGAQAEVAATSLRNVGRMLSRGDFGATKSQRNAFKELGIDAEKVAKAMQIDASGTLMEVLAAISEAEPHKKLALMSGVFGDEARALMPLLGELENTRKMLKEVGDETNYLGSVQKEFETRSKTGTYALQKFKNQLRDVAISMGQSLLPAMKEVLSIIGPILIRIGDWAQANPKLVASIMAVVGAVVALKVAIAGLSYIGLLGRGGALAIIAGGARMLGGTVGYLWGAAKGAVALQVALAGLGGGKVGILAKIAIGARGMLMAIPGMAGLAKAFGLIGAAVKAVWAIMLANPIAVAVAAIAGAAFLIYKNWDSVKPYFVRLWDGVKGICQGFADWIMGILTLDFERAVNGLKAIFTNWNDIGQTMYDAGVAIFQALWDGMKSLWDGMKSWVGGVGDAVVAPFKGAAARVRGWFSDGGGDAPPGRAKGGAISAGTTYLVGEEGPELITPSKGGYVHPNGTGPGAAGGASITLAPVFNFTGMTAADASAIEQRVRGALDREIRQLLNGVFADTGVRTSGAF